MFYLLNREKYLLSVSIPPSVLSVMFYPTQALALDAAVGGGGIALADRRLVENDIKGVRLILFEIEIDVRSDK